MPFLIAIGGHCGTGKSTLGHALPQACPALGDALVLDFDQGHREMLGYDLKTVMKPEDYASEVIARLRARMDEKIAAALKAGRDVIDASGYFGESERKNIEELAESCGAEFVGLWLIVPIEVMERRILKRRAERRSGKPLSVEKGHASDACLCVLDKFGDIGQPESKEWTILKADGSVENVLALAQRALKARCRKPDAPHTDIAAGDWIDRYLPAWARVYARLMRLDRPIGTWLLLWPCIWSAALAAPEGGGPDLWSLFLFALGAVVMRGAGCIVNDLWDRDIDPKVERTAGRPLASGALNPLRAILFLGALLAVGLAILLQFNALTVWIGIASLPLVLAYPLAKRFTYWPQFVLGLTFNWGAWLGWTAARGQIGAGALLLYLAGIFWTLGYDTIYAHQDKRDDALIGIKSLALYLGERSRPWMAAFYAAFLVLLALAGAASGVDWPFYPALLLPASHAAWQLGTWEMDDPANCLMRFRSNRDFGLFVLAAIQAGKLL